MAPKRPGLLLLSEGLYFPIVLFPSFVHLPVDLNRQDNPEATERRFKSHFTG
jgi:hypothetical protein